MSYQETVETVNAALVDASDSDAMQCRKLVTEVYLQAADILMNETGGTWPEKSITKKIIDGSQVLQDMFVMLSQADRSEHIRDIKFTFQNYDAVVTEGETNGWRKMDAMRKAIAKAEREQAAADTPDTGDTGEDTEEDMTPNGQRDDYASSIYALLIKAEQAGHDPAQVIQDVVNLFKNK